MKRRRAEDQFDIVLESVFESSDEDEEGEDLDEAIDEVVEDKDQDEAIDEDEEDKDQDEAIDEDEEGEDDSSSRGGPKSHILELVDWEDEEEYDKEEEEYGGGGDVGKAAKEASADGFFDGDGEEEDYEDGGSFEAFERLLQEKDVKNRTEYYYDDDDDDDDATEADQQALLQSMPERKVFTLKCVTGHEREVVICLMQKCIERGSELQIRSAIFFEHVKKYIFIEADEKSHVIEACKGLRNIYTGNKDLLGPIKEKTDVLSVESKPVDLSRDTWVRMKIGTHKGDLAKVVDVDNVRQSVTVKLIPRIDLQALSNKWEGREVPKKKTLTPPPRFMNLDEARGVSFQSEMQIVDSRRDPVTSDYFENINDMMFKDGFLYETVSMKSISIQNIQPTFDELEKFLQPNENGGGDIASLSTLFANRKKGHFMEGDRVVIKGDLTNLKGWVEKVEEDTVHIKPNINGLPKTLAVSQRELCKYFEPGNYVRVVSGAQEGATGMVLTVQGHLVNIASDATKEVLRVFSDNVAESSQVTSGIAKIGDFELHDLVQLDNSNFGVIIRVEREAFQVLKGVSDRAEVELVRLRDIKYKIDKKLSARDRFKNTVSVKDVVVVIEGPWKGRQGPVEHIYRGIFFVYDRRLVEHAGFICAESQSCVLVGGPRENPGGPNSRACEAPSPGGTYSEAGTPRDSTPADANAPGPYLPSTPGGQPPPITPGLFLPGILVTVRRSGDDAVVGVIQEVLLDGAYWVAVGGEMITANPHEMEVVVRRKLDK